jgi:hypothetical protein
MRWKAKSSSSRAASRATCASWPTPAPSRTPAGRPGGLLPGAPRHPHQPGRPDQRRRAGRRGRRPRRCGHLRAAAARQPAADPPYRDRLAGDPGAAGHVLARRKAARFDALLDFDIVGLHPAPPRTSRCCERPGLGRPLKARHAGARLRRHRAAGRSRPGRGRAAGRGGAAVLRRSFVCSRWCCRRLGAAPATCWPCASRTCCRRGAALCRCALSNRTLPDSTQASGARKARHDRPHPVRQAVGRTRRPHRGRRHRRALHRPPPGARGDQPAGLRRPAPGRPQGLARQLVVATADHNTPTTGWDRGYDGITDPISKLQVRTLDANIKAFGAAAYFPFLDKRQGIVHVIGPEQGATLPGMTVVCGDSHTSTHGAFGALAHGIGTSEVEHVMATQTLLAKKAKNMLVKVDGQLARGVTAKDIVLAIIGKIGTAGGTGYTIEFGGSAIRALSMEGRMTVCNMAIEAGARAGLVAVDDKTINYVQGPPLRAQGRGMGPGRGLLAHAAVRPRRALRRRGRTRRRADEAAGHLGHQPRDGAVHRRPRARPRQGKGRRQARRHRARAHLHGPAAQQGHHRHHHRQGLHRLSCTNSRIEDLRDAAAVVRRWAARWRPTSSWRWWCRARAW